MSDLNVDDEYDDLMITSNSGEATTKPSLNVNTVKNTLGERPKQESVIVFKEVPPSVMNHVKSVSYPPTKQTRFSLATSELEKELEQRIKEVIPCARIEFKPNKAEVADATIMEGNTSATKEKTDPCNIPNRRIGCMNFIHQDRQKDGSTSTKYIEIMFFNFENKEEYERIKPVVVEFFKEMDTSANVSMNQNMRGGKRTKKIQKTQKKKKQAKSKTKSKRRLRK